MKTHHRPGSGIIAVTIKTQDGERTVSTGCTNAKQAARVIKAAGVGAIEVAAKASALSQELIQKLVAGKKLTVAQAIDEWREWLNHVSASDRTAFCHVSYVKKWARESRVLTMAPALIKEKHIGKWINAQDGNKLATKRAAMSAVHSFFSYCSIKQYCLGDPSRLVRIKPQLLTHEQKEPRQKIPFTDEELKKLIDYLLSHLAHLDAQPRTEANLARIETARFWYCATLIGRHAGLRMGDICSLEWASLTTPGKLIVWTDKKDTRVELDMTDELFKGVSAIPTNSNKFCFPGQNAINRSNKRYKLSVQFGRILQRVDVAGHTFHDLRHSFAMECRAEGMTRSEISSRLGHGSRDSTEVYLDHKST
jgi:integrase